MLQLVGFITVFFPRHLVPLVVKLCRLIICFVLAAAGMHTSTYFFHLIPYSHIAKTQMHYLIPHLSRVCIISLGDSSLGLLLTVCH